MRELAGGITIARFARALLLAGGVRALGAQSVQEYERKVTILEADARRADAAVAEYRRIVDERAKVRDTVRAGALVVVSGEAIAPIVRAAAGRAIETLQSKVGGATSRLSGHVFFARLGGSGFTSSEQSVITGEMDPHGEARSESWHGQSVEDLTRTFIELGLRVIGGGMSPAFRVWASGSVPTDSMSAAAWSTQRVAMVSSPTTVARRCYDGDLGACRVALGLSDVADPVLDWYDAKDRRRLVGRFAEEDHVTTPIFASCLAGDDGACVTALRRRNFLPTPFSDVNRTSLMREAIAMGGPGALERLITASSDRPYDHIAAAAGVSVDSVLTAWQRNVHDRRVQSDDMSIRMALMSATWILIFGAASLRSPRWR